MKRLHLHHDPVHYGLMPSAFLGLGLIVFLIVVYAAAWLLRLIAMGLGF